MEDDSSESKMLRDYQSCLDLFQQQAALDKTRFTGMAADVRLAYQTMDLALNTPLCPRILGEFPTQLLNFLESSARTLPRAPLRMQLTEALCFLIYAQMIDFVKTLPVLMELQTLGDEGLQQVAYGHVTNSVTRMNRDDPKNKALQIILFEMLQQQKDEAKAERALITLCDLHGKKVWSDDTTADAICRACLHPSSRVMIAALSFLLDFEGIEHDDDSDDSDDDSDDDDSDDDENDNDDDDDDSDDDENDMVSHEGTTSSKKKKAKLQHVPPSMKQQQRLISFENSNTNYSSPLNHLKDAEGFSKNLFSRLQSSSNESLKVRIMMIGVIAQTVSLHQVILLDFYSYLQKILLDFYSYLQKYAEPDTRHVTTVLAASVLACHKEVPRLVVEPLYKQILNKFVEGREDRLEVITVGMNAACGMRFRVPEMMTDFDKSRPKEREFSDFNAANISLGAMKKLMRKPIKYTEYTTNERYVDKGHYATICKLRNGTDKLTEEQELACNPNTYFIEHLPGWTVRHKLVRLPLDMQPQEVRDNPRPPQEICMPSYMQEEQKKPAASEAKIARTCQEMNKKRK